MIFLYGQSQRHPLDRLWEKCLLQESSYKELK